MNDILSVISWWLIVTAAGVLVFPLQFRLFKFLPDRGYALSKTAGLLAMGYVGWLLGNFGFVEVDTGGVIISLLIVGVISLVALRGHADEMTAWFKDARHSMLTVEILFLVAFAFWAYSRSLNPNITFTEKPMEFGFLNSVLRTGTQPPGDPWLSGYAISYYHFGYVIIGMLTALSGVLPSVAFNLGIALLFALTAVGAFGVVLNLVASTQRSEATEKKPVATSLIIAIFPALLGPLFMLIGNFNAVLEVAHKSGVGAVNAGQPILCPSENRFCLNCASVECATFNPLSSIWSWIDIKWTNDPPVANASVDASGQPTSPSWMPDRFLWYWQSSRVIHDRDLSGAEVEVIDEFPFFSFLLGDMHPHVLGLPFVFLAIAFALNLYLMVQADADPKTPAFDRTQWREQLKHLLPLDLPTLLYGAVILGGLSFLNTWDFPIYLFVVVGAYTVARAMRDGWLDVWQDSIVLALSLAILGVVLYLPFYIGFRSQLGGVLPNLVFGTRLPQFLVMFGPSLIIVSVLLVWYAINRPKAMNWRNGLWVGLGTPLILILLVTVMITAALTIFANQIEVQAAINAVLGSAPITDAFNLIMRRRLELERLFTIVLICAVLTAAAAIAFGAKRDTENESEEETEPKTRSLSLVPFLAVLIVTGALLTLGPEFVYLRDFFSTRMNTIFKFYYQVWVLWSLVAAFSVWLIFRLVGPLGRALFGSAATLIVVGGLLFPILATATVTGDWKGTVRNEANEPYATLDGMAYMATVRTADYEAIKFLNETVKGRPVIAEAIGGSYSEYARVSAHTGLPTVLGWPFHEVQWRGSSELFSGKDDDLGRENDIRTLYTSNDWTVTQSILQKYDIQYVYVGQMEYGLYGSIALENFDRNLSKIYEANGVIIYEYKGDL